MNDCYGCMEGWANGNSAGRCPSVRPGPAAPASRPPCRELVSPQAIGSDQGFGEPQVAMLRLELPLLQSSNTHIWLNRNGPEIRRLCEGLPITQIVGRAASGRLEKQGPPPTVRLPRVLNYVVTQVSVAQDRAPTLPRCTRRSLQFEFKTPVRVSSECHVDAATPGFRGVFFAYAETQVIELTQVVINSTVTGVVTS